MHDDDGDVHTDSESLEKRCKYDPMAEIHNLSSLNGLKPHSAKSSKDQTAEVDEEIRHYMVISGAILKHCKKYI